MLRTDTAAMIEDCTDRHIPFEGCCNSATSARSIGIGDDVLAAVREAFLE